MGNMFVLMVYKGNAVVIVLTNGDLIGIGLHNISSSRWLGFLFCCLLIVYKFATRIRT